MEVFVFIFVGVVAMAVSAVPLMASFDTPTRAIFAGFGTLAWAVWAFHANSVQIYSSGVQFDASYRSLMFLGIAAAIVQLLFLVKAVVGTVGEADINREVTR